MSLQQLLTYRIDICSRIHDARADLFKEKFANLGYKISAVTLIDSYSCETDCDAKFLDVAAKVLVNPIKEKLFLASEASRFDYALEIGFLPGVTDNVANTATESLKDYLGKAEIKIYSSQVLLLNTEINLAKLNELALNLYNPLIQKIKIKNYQEFIQDSGMGVNIPKVKLDHKVQVTAVDLNVSDTELEKIGMEGIADADGRRRGPLALGLDYMKAIQEYFQKLGRKANDIELESIAQTWSEHCKHTIFADSIDEVKDGLYKAYIKAATNTIRKNKGAKDFCVSVFSDNSGVIDFDDEFVITHKVETHNSPSALDPFGGAITGIVGVNRDAIGCGMGAKPIANLYGYCFADPSDQVPIFRDKKLTQAMLSPKRIMEGVIEGVKVGGNHSGIPTVHGFSYFHESYKGKPIVFVGTLGLMPRAINGKSSSEKQAQVGDYIVMLGGRVGLDGIHGATFSSVEMDSASPVTAVQIGDPITQKKFSDAIVKEARDKGLYNSITDNGAGGISCSVAEMARECGGCYVELEKVPLKYPGMQPWQIWISESQERMTLSVHPTKWEEFSRLMKSRDVEATIIGKFTDSGKAQVSYQGQTIMDIELEFLHNGLPGRQLETRKPSQEWLRANSQGTMENVIARSRGAELNEEGLELNAKLLDLLRNPNYSSHEFISQQYDHEVQGNSVIKPLQGRGRVNGDVAVIRPRLKSNKGVVLSYGLYPEYIDDSYQMAANAIDMALRSAVAAGADIEKTAILDNFCWCSGNEPERLYQLKDAARACYDYAVAYGTPFISGKDSMFNDFKGYDASGKPIKISALPTLLISAISVIEDHRQVVSMDLKVEGDLIYLLGDDASENGVIARSGEAVTWRSPSVDAIKNLKLYKNLQSAISKGLIASSQSVSRGGLAIALTKKTMAGTMGVEIEYAGERLFTEVPGRILVSIDPTKKIAFEECFKENEFKCIGSVKGKAVVVYDKNKKVLELSIDGALQAYRSKFASYLYQAENAALAGVS